MFSTQFFVALACIWAPLAELATGHVTIYNTTAKAVATADALAAVATLAAYDQTVLTSPPPPNPAIATNILVQVCRFKPSSVHANRYVWKMKLYPNGMDGLSIKWVWFTALSAHS
jgi:hypothetical protein